MATEAQALIQYPTVREALAKKFSHPHYITLFEVRDSTGFDSTRSADAMSIALYGTKGREINGFEIKHSRSDWLRELKSPAKAEEIGKFCDWFYLVTNDESVARIDELPMPWGWMVLKGERLKVIKKPERMKPLALDRHMLCSLLYSVRKQCFAEIEQQIKSAVEERVKNEANGLKYQAQQWEVKYYEVMKTIKEFEDASGVSINIWENNSKIGAAVRRVLKEGDKLVEYKRDLEWICNRAKTVASNVERELAELEKENNANSPPNP